LAAPQPTEVPVEAINERGKLTGEKKARYLLRQLDLTEEQATYAEGLIETIITAPREAPPINIDEVRQIWREMEKAKEAGDQEKVEALGKQLQRMGREATGDAEFFANLEPQLTQTQKQKLEQAEARLARNPSGALRPVDLLRIVITLDLTEEQKRKVLDAHVAVRKRLGPLLRPGDQLKLDMVNICIRKLHEMLTPEQQAEFAYRVRTLRPDLTDRGLRVSRTEPSAGQSTGQKQPTGD
jgi:hypothetical protein